jgi:uncharacterized membrane protein
VAIGRQLAAGAEHAPAAGAAEYSAAERGAASRALDWLGRFSLPIYLLHQPLLYGGLFLLASLTATANRPADGYVDRDTSGFRTECPRACEGQGNAREHCARYCTCAETEMKASGIWQRVMRSQEASVIQPDLAPLLQACFEKARNRP